MQSVMHHWKGRVKEGRKRVEVLGQTPGEEQARVERKEGKAARR